MRLLRAELRLLNRKDFRMIFERITRTWKALEKVQTDLQIDLFNTLLQKNEKSLLVELQ